MSDRLRRGAGTVLAAAAVLACFVPAATAPGKPAERYRSGNRVQWVPASISTEKHENGIRINEADPDELTGLHGIGETLAAMIDSERNANGPFYYPEDLEAVRGIGPRTLEKFREQTDLTLDESGE